MNNFILHNMYYTFIKYNNLLKVIKNYRIILLVIDIVTKKEVTELLRN